MIESLNNQTIAKARKLLQKKYRYEYRQYLIEGVKLVAEAVKFHQNINCVFSTEERKIDSYQTVTVSEKVIDSLSETVNNQGVVAVVDMPENLLTAPDGNCLILENLQDAGNMGTILRTAAACGYNQVYLVNCVDPYSPKVLRSAMSAHFILKIYQGDLDKIMQCLSNRCQILCADMDGENVFKTSVAHPHALIIGNEGNGISEKALSYCNKKISLPMENNLESLNAAVCAGILMYQLTNREK